MTHNRTTQKTTQISDTEHKEGPCLIYVICVCLRIVVCFLFCLSSSCVPYVASFFGLSIFDSSFGILTTQISDTEHMTAYPEKSPTCNKSLPTLLYPSTPRDGWMGIELTFSDTDIVLTMFIRSEYRVVMSAWKRCSVRLYLQLFVGGPMSHLRYLCLFAYSSVLFVLFVFVLCTLCCQLLYTSALT
jgi:hypothetical protein